MSVEHDNATRDDAQAEHARTAGDYVGQAVDRLEDHRFITGAATYVDDITLPGMLFAAFVRSPHPHARVLGVDVAAALEHPRCFDVLTGAEALALAGPMPVYTYAPAQALGKPEYRCLAADRVRFVQEPVAVVAATDRYSADDVAETVEVDYEPLPVVVDPERALEPGAVKLHEHLESNLGIQLSRSGGDFEAALREADGVLRRRLGMHRHTGAPIEPRGVVASYNAGQGALTVWISNQAPHVLRAHLAEILDFPESRIRVIAPDIGGGFGSKIQVPPEGVAICLLAMKTGRPVKWIETRSESLSAFVHAREQLYEVEVPYRYDGTVLGIRARSFVDAGAYLDSRISGPALHAALWLPGVYRMKGYEAEIRIVMTNKCPYGAYRGLGGQMGAFVIERCMDLVAAELGLDRAEVRRRQLIRSAELPYRTLSGLLYDSGDYEAALDKALAALDYPALLAEQARLRGQGRYMGIGLAMAVEGSGFNTYTAPMARPWVPTQDYSTVRVQMDVSGRATVFIGNASCGTGHETTAAQVAADALGVRIEQVDVVEGDTAATPYDSGMRAARFASIVIPGVAAAASTLNDRIRRVAAHALEASPEDIEVRRGRASVRGTDVGMTVQRIAQIAHAEVRSLPADVPAGLEATESFRVPAQSRAATYPYAVHMPVVEVDVETGMTRFLRYVIVDDCGVAINPRIVEGQIVGGTAQGIGGTLFEELVYDEDGQLLTSTFMDYLLPTARELPNFEVHHMSTPAPEIPGGFKGMGEGGCIYSYAAVVSAVADALAPLGVEVTRTPLSPRRIREYLRDASAREAAAEARRIQPPRE